MIETAGPGRRLRLATCLVAAMMCMTFAGCQSTGKGKVEDEEFAYLDPFGPKDFKEVETKLPPPPVDANLIPFEVGTTGQLSFAVDSKSVVVGDDGAVRYTVVIRSPSGARNVSYEGVRCDTFERKLFATLPPGADKWVPNRSEDRDTWKRMETAVRNGYAATLAVDFLCDGRSAAGKAADIVRDMRDHAPRKAVYR